MPPKKPDRCIWVGIPCNAFNWGVIRGAMCGMDEFTRCKRSDDAIENVRRTSRNSNHKSFQSVGDMLCLRETQEYDDGSVQGSDPGWKAGDKSLQGMWMDGQEA